MSDKKLCAIASCNAPINEKCITCSGLCNKVVHPACIKLSTTSVPLFISAKNFKWFCDDCCDSIGSILGNLDQLLQITRSISFDVKNLNKDVRNVTSSKEVSMDSCGVVTRLQKKKTVTPEANTGSLSSPVLRPVPESTRCIVGSCVESNEIKSVPERKFLYASRFASSTSKEAIVKYLSNKLNIPEDEFICHLLVPANLDVNKLNFVSFKIGLSPEMFKKALVSEIWPAGVLVREFVSRAKNVVVGATLPV